MSSNLSIRQTFQAAWQNLNGVKGPTWAMLILAMISLIGTNLIMFSLGRAFYHEQDLPMIWLSLISPIAMNIVIGIFLSGILIPSIKKLRHEPITTGTGFHYFHRALQMTTYMLIFGFINSVVMYFMQKTNVAHGNNPDTFSVYLGIAILVAFVLRLLMYVAAPTIADTRCSAFQAIGASLRKTTRVIHKIFLIEIGLMVLMLITILPLLAGTMLMAYSQKVGAIVMSAGFLFTIICFVWLAPFSLLIQAKVYLQLED